MDQKELLHRLKIYKVDTNISYKVIAQECEIGLDVIYKFTGGVRNLTADKAERLNEYLLDKGY